MYIYASVEDEGDKNSPISMIEVRPIRFANLKKSKKVELLSKEIKAEYNGKRYTLKVVDKTAVLPYKEGIILKEGTIIYFGKIKVDDKLIIEMPPIKFESYVEVSKYVPILDGLNIETNKEIYHGPTANYKGR